MLRRRKPRGTESDSPTAWVRSRTFKLKNALVFFRFALCVTLTRWVQARSRGRMEKPAASPRSCSCCSERSEPCPPTEPADFPGSQPKTEALISISCNFHCSSSSLPVTCCRWEVDLEQFFPCFRRWFHSEYKFNCSRRAAALPRAVSQALPACSLVGIWLGELKTELG